MKITTMDILILGYLFAQLSSRLFVLSFGGVGTPDLNGLLDIILIPLILYWIVKNLMVSRAHVKWFLYALVIASLLICFSGLYEQVMGVRIFKASLSLGGSEVRYIWQDVPGGRAAGAMGNPAIYGGILGIGILASIACLSQAKRTLAHIAFITTICVLSYGVFASYTRSAWVSVFIVLFIIQFFVNGLWKKTLPIFVFGLLFMAITWKEIPGVATIVHRATYTNSLPVRFDLINLGWNRFLERPFFGWGSGALNAFGLMQFGDTSHNIYLTFLVDGGVVLFISFSVAIGYLMIRAMRVYNMTEKRSLERNALVAMTGFVLIFLLSGLALELRYFGYFNAIFWICAGVIDLLGTRCSIKESNFT